MEGAQRHVYLNHPRECTECDDVRVVAEGAHRRAVSRVALQLVIPRVSHVLKSDLPPRFHQANHGGHRDAHKPVRLVNIDLILPFQPPPSHWSPVPDAEHSALQGEHARERLARDAKMPIPVHACLAVLDESCSYLALQEVLAPPPLEGVILLEVHSPSCAMPSQPSLHHRPVPCKDVKAPQSLLPGGGGRASARPLRTSIEHLYTIRVLL